ncbi:MAG: hypothetical protein HYZ42_02030 [Bacteroidetes bacterium]|nr:hypothetical protein [Bacteroidota bacterium]
MNIYYPLWEKQMPIIALQIKNAKNGEKVIQLQKHEFESMGNRKLSNYTFSLDIVNNRIVKNTMKGNAVAKDLFDKLMQNESVKENLLNKHYKINMGKDFILKINIIKAEPKEEELEVLAPAPEEPVSEN